MTPALDAGEEEQEEGKGRGGGKGGGEEDMTRKLAAALGAPVAEIIIPLCED